MKNLGKYLKIYGVLGKLLCAVAGGVIGFVSAGPLFAFPGVLAGLLAAHLLESAIVDQTN